MDNKDDKENLKEGDSKEETKSVEKDNNVENSKIEKITSEKKVKNIIALSIFILLIIVAYVAIKVDKYNNLVYPKSYIYDTDVSSLNKEKLENCVAEIEKDFLNTKISIKCNNEEFIVSTNEIILSTDKENLMKNIMNYNNDISILENIKELTFSNNKNYKFSVKFNEDVLNKKIKDIANKTNTKYKDAKVIIDQDNIRIEKEKSGLILNEVELKKSIYDEVKNFNNKEHSIVVEAKYDKYDAKVKENDLRNVDTKISEYHTIYSGSSGRKSNVENASKKIDDMILMPGDEFSYEKAVGPVTYENGYKDAPVIINGKTSVGVGGGVCQVSSTLYNTQLKAGLLPTQRRNHSKAVSYVPRGLDATLASGSIDYKFKNTYDYPIVINTYTKDSNVYIEFWSNKEATKGIKYEPISFISGKSAKSYLYGYDSIGNKVYEKFIDTSIYK